MGGVSYSCQGYVRVSTLDLLNYEAWPLNSKLHHYHRHSQSEKSVLCELLTPLSSPSNAPVNCCKSCSARHHGSQRPAKMSKFSLHPRKPYMGTHHNPSTEAKTIARSNSVVLLQAGKRTHNFGTLSNFNMLNAQLCLQTHSGLKRASND